MIRPFLATVRSLEGHARAGGRARPDVTVSGMEVGTRPPKALLCRYWTVAVVSTRLLQ